MSSIVEFVYNCSYSTIGIFYNVIPFYSGPGVISLAYNGLPSWMASIPSLDTPEVEFRGAQWLRYKHAAFSAHWGNDTSGYQRPAL